MHLQGALSCSGLAALPAPRRLPATFRPLLPPAAVSAMSCWARAEALGYVTLTTDGRIAMHDSKVGVGLSVPQRCMAARGCTDARCGQVQSIGALLRSPSLVR